MHEEAGLLLILMAAIGLIVLLVVKFRVHSFLALMLASFVVGAGAGMPLSSIADSFEKGMGGTLHAAPAPGRHGDQPTAGR